MKPKYVAFAMKIFLVYSLIINVNCDKNSTPSPPPPPPPPPPVLPPSACATCKLIYYDDVQQGAPELEGGAYEAAARFTPAIIGNLVGKTIKDIQYYIALKPDSIKVKLYGQLDSTHPGNLLYEADVTGSAKPSTWNVHPVGKPVTLKNEDIWLSIEFKIQGTRKTIGCDPGPAHSDGDWLYKSSDNQWMTFRSRSGSDINWTIRLEVSL